MNGTELEKILALLKRLQEARIFYTLAHNQEDAISIQVVVPGQRWEIDCHVNGTVDVEIFKSDGVIHDSTAIDRLFRDFSDRQ
jgi:hypothetical protein